MDDILSLCANEAAVNRIRAHRQRVAKLLDRGVTCLSPETLEIGEDVDLTQIHPTVTLHAGTRIQGPRTVLGPNVELGREAPVTVSNCVLGPNVVLDGGYFEGTTMLDGVSVRSGAHFRPGTLLEERAGAGHCVGLKQTILFPYVTLGSLINFCDCLMAGGTSRRDHSEVGSGYIHFNFTPRGDKLTPSLFGDVPRGVLLDQPRVFLGGLAASVGPMRVGFGAFLGPGAVYRRDVKDGRFLLSEKPIVVEMGFDPKVLAGLPRKLHKTFEYIGHLAALWQWYQHVRALFADAVHQPLYRAAQETVLEGIRERIKQIDRVVAMIPESLQRLRAQQASPRTIAYQSRLADRWPAIEACLTEAYRREGDLEARDQCLRAVAPAAQSGRYLEVIPALPADAKQAAVRWLQGVVDSVLADARGALEADSPTS